MVLIHLKISDRNQFLLEVPNDSKCEETLKHLVLSKILNKSD